MEYKQSKILQNINSPADLRKLPVEELPELCEEIRKYIIESCANNPGHFGSSMGAVEIIVALHYVFDTPNDRLVWDVGHQAYAHKILTGRRDEFPKQRTYEGISGFPFPDESIYDTFVCGHAGNSISAALGMSVADRLSNEQRKTVALIGDASISNGLAFEGLNNAANQPNNLLIVLNDNDMSIDSPVGSLHRYLSEITTSAPYNKWRFKIYNLCKKLGLINDHRKGLLLRFNNAIKSLIAANQNIFEGLNIRYLGPFDGNDVVKLVKVFSDIKDMTGPRILHLRTVKGKGFEAAEKDPQSWHAPGNFNPQTGAKISTGSKSKPWQDIFGEELVELAKENSKITGVSAAMLSGTSMSKMMEAFPDRTFDVGISEGHAVTFAGGMASAGKHPFVAIYSSFLQRAFDSIIHDVAIQGLPVTFCIDRAGIVGEDGVTHHGLFDLAYLRMIPGMSIASPLDPASLRQLMKLASRTDAPVSIRYPRGKALDSGTKYDEIQYGKGRRIHSSLSKSHSIAILSVGPVGVNVLNALNILGDKGIDVDVFDMVWVKPLDVELLGEISNSYRHIVTVEDGIVTGGFGCAVEEYLTSNGYRGGFTKLGVPDNWIYQGSVAQLQKKCGYDAEGIAKKIENIAMKEHPKTFV